MSRSKLIWSGLFVGGAIGGYVPAFWGAGLISITSIIFSAMGSFIGIYLGYKIGQ